MVPPEEAAAWGGWTANMVDNWTGLDKGKDATIADPGTKRDDQIVFIRTGAGSDLAEDGVRVDCRLRDEVL